jgi:hypothetical protein
VRGGVEAVLVALVGEGPVVEFGLVGGGVDLRFAGPVRVIVTMYSSMYAGRIHVGSL